MAGLKTGKIVKKSINQSMPSLNVNKFNIFCIFAVPNYRIVAIFV